ncbi:TerB family tellurite resistance protein [Thalassomonas actiniarum]|uniref:TerB family tellurite resistance protein n=1 Tax=Thalassomonas actiniarum TaxID=485447 RepID=A0AAE9YSL4_9GAMM|nr:TerB family tellurite resistance protein [Thalassomonas actiniarum]WDD99539.1 TerB family tellurite resistance protein [Thalassomonas actiniarum]
MLTKITLFFQFLNDGTASENEQEISLEIACAVLLCEVMRADGHFDPQEQAHISKILMTQFQLTPAEVAEIIDQAIKLSEHATDFYQFTSKINQHYSLEQRINMVCLLWQLAYADGELAAIEEHIIRKIADLLYLNHHEYIQAKLAAQQ